MILPGPEAQQLAIYIGWKLHGKRGGIVAGTLFVLPSMFVMLALSIVYVRFSTLPWVVARFSGLKLAVIALVIVALLRTATMALRGLVQSVVAVATFAAMFFFDVSTAVVVGAILDLTVFLGKRVIFPSGVVGLKHVSAIAVGGVLVSLLLLQKFKLKIIPLGEFLGKQRGIVHKKRSAEALPFLCGVENWAFSARKRKRFATPHSP